MLFIDRSTHDINESNLSQTSFPKTKSRYNQITKSNRSSVGFLHKKMPVKGIEPSTIRLQIERSTIELHRRRGDFISKIKIILNLINRYEIVFQ